MKTTNSKDIGAGLVFLAIGAFFCIQSWTELTIGTAQRMGPGYYPLVVSVLLLVLGAVVLFRAFGSEGTDYGTVPWRSVILIGLAPIAFGLAVRPLGLIPAIALTSLFSAFASRQTSLVAALALIVGLTIFCVVLFHYLLGLPIRLFGPWLGA